MEQETYGHNFECVFCETDVKYGDCQETRVLPCLHVACTRCIQQCLKEKAARSSGIFSCPSCDFKVQELTTVSGSPGKLRDIPLLFKTKVQQQLSSKKESPHTAVPIDGAHTSQSKLGDITNGCHSDKREAECQMEEDKDVLLNGTGGEESMEDSSGSSSRTSPVGDVSKEQFAFYCTTCDEAITTVSVDVKHFQHDLVKLPQMIKNKKDYIQNLLKQVTEMIKKGENKIKQIAIVKDHLRKTQAQLGDEIENRAQHLIEMIEKRKTTLLKELNQVCEAQDVQFVQEVESQKKRIKMFKDSHNFAERVLMKGTDDDLLAFHNDITNRLLQLIHHMKDYSLEILSIRVDVPERGKEESHLEKLFGSLMQGNISCGDAELLLSFNIDLKWPTSLITSKTRDIVIAGKAGTFDSQGRLLFYDRQGKLQSGHEFEDKCIPSDVACASDGTILVSDNHGRISKFTPHGKKFEIMENKFSGSSGRLALTTEDHILVTSADDNCIMMYDFGGQKIGQLTASPTEDFTIFSQPHCLATNLNNDFILSDLKGHSVAVYNSQGDLKFRYSGADLCGDNLKCPSSICCDPFNNILVADFTNDTVHLVSSTGEFLGYLLTKHNGISCPNFLSLDHEGHLFVGQYGGDISVFRYLSCVKHA